ncbi:class I SAM-dependent methyltransferase [Pseudonocardia aurantiaca]|uniref:Class I SAM-dependent methyltransferase n=1 Tax=Pseudonocardia aurantiaca TaxID=75290 RepID=A0ABW4FQG7_9PSEU
MEDRSPPPMEPATGTDPRLDLVADSIDLHRGHIRFVHPRDPAALLYEEDVASDQAYPPYWAEVWPSAVELAYAVSAHDWNGAAVLELGCGLGLPAIAAGLAGARVLATDRSADAIMFAAVNAEQNGAAVETAVCSWSEPGPLLARAPWRLVLASDVLYGQRNVDELLDLLPRLVGDEGAAWIADPRRPLTDYFLAAAGAEWRSVETTPTREPEVLIHRLTGPLRPAPAGVRVADALRE